MNKHEIELLSQEIEMLMNERARLLKVVGAAAVLVANADAAKLQPNAVEAAEMLSETLNALPEETLRDALESVHAEPDEAVKQGKNREPDSTQDRTHTHRRRRARRLSGRRTQGYCRVSAAPCTFPVPGYLRHVGRRAERGDAGGECAAVSQGCEIPARYLDQRACKRHLPFRRARCFYEQHPLAVRIGAEPDRHQSHEQDFPAGQCAAGHVSGTDTALRKDPGEASMRAHCTP